MTWMGPNLSFILITALVVISACFAAFSRSMARAAFSLFFTLAGMAGYYVLLGSDFVAVTQVIIYVGGILVLLMFGVLLTNRGTEPVHEKFIRRNAAAGAAGLALLLLVLLPVIRSAPWRPAASLGEPSGNVDRLGALLLGDYSIVLLTAGMTLLLCLVGAAYLVRRRDQ